MALDHYVPQVHLRRFYAADLGSRKMHAFRKTDSMTFPCGSADVCRIPDGNTNAYLSEPRLVEEFLKLVEPNYNSACAILERGEVNPDVVFVIAGFAASVMSCSPTGMRLESAPHEARLPLEAQLMEQAGLLPPAPPELGDLTLADMLADGSIVFEVDQRFPQAIGISNIVGRATAFGNFHWDILLNQHPSSPFFTSDFPVAIEATPDLRVVNRVVPLTPTLAVRICPRIALAGKKLEPTFEHFSFRVLEPNRQGIAAINRTIARSAETLVFSSSAAPWVHDFVRKHSRFRVEVETTVIPQGTGFLTIDRSVVRERPRA